MKHRNRYVVTTMKKWLTGMALTLMAGFCIPAASAEALEATLQWARKVELTTPVSGRIDEVLVEPGDRVDKGKPMLRLDARGFEARVAQAEAQVAKTKEALAEAERELERAQELYDRTVFSVHDLQLAQIAHTSAQSDHRRAQSELTQARLDLEYSVIRAPFNGMVVDRRAQPGETVVTRLQATPLLVVVDAERMGARAAVTEEQLARLEPGQTVQVRVGDRTYDAEVVRLGLEPLSSQQGSALFAVDAEFSVSGERVFRSGQKAELIVP